MPVFFPQGTLKQLGGPVGAFQIVGCRAGIQGVSNQVGAGNITSSTYMSHKLPYGAKSILPVYACFNNASPTPTELTVPASAFVPTGFVLAATGALFAAGDTITFANTATGNATSTVVLVLTVSAGAITSAVIVSPGWCTVPLPAASAPTSTSGSGVSATFSFTYVPYAMAVHGAVVLPWQAAAAGGTSPTGRNIVTSGVSPYGTTIAGVGLANNDLLGTPGDLIVPRPVRCNQAAGSSIGMISWGGGPRLYGGRAVAQSRGEFANAGAALADKTITGSIFAGTGNASIYPMFILGIPQTPGASLIIQGDSLDQWTISAGGTTTTDLGDTDGNMGPVERAINSLIPFTTLAASGDRAQYWTDPTSGAAAYRFNGIRELVEAGLLTIHSIWDGLGVNDTTSGVSLATLQANKQAIWTFWRSMGANKIFTRTITPVTTSTDSFATVANQTKSTGDSVRQGWNAWVRPGGAGALLIDGMADYALLAESSTNSGIWRVDVSATADGTHFTQGFMQGQVTALVASILNLNTVTL